MREFHFQCPTCAVESTVDWDPGEEVLCVHCNTIWETDYSHDIEAVWITKKAEEQPQFNISIAGTKISGCMGITVERVREARTVFRGGIGIATEPLGDPHFFLKADFHDYPDCLTGRVRVDLQLIARPERKLSLKVDVHGGGGHQLIFELASADEANKIYALWHRCEKKETKC